jgi:2-polyprenyl-6-methoxyphenol hydroxylase-like FAD-dependent oxidoreductase
VTATTDVLVVGAGPTGLTLAAQLQRLGARVRIVDRQIDRVHESRALAVQPRTLEVLRTLGISDKLVERGNNAVQLRPRFGERVVPIRLYDVGLEDSAYPFLFVSQAETEAVLSEHLAEAGIAVERGVELLTLTTDDQQVSCTLGHRDGSTVRQRHLARRRPITSSAADGNQSRQRSSAAKTVLVPRRSATTNPISASMPR